MSITTRLLIFSLVALGIVLLGFSAVLYALASWHLHDELDQELAAARHILVASIEVHPHDVEWEPQERAVTLGRDADASRVRWVIRDQTGELIDCSANLGDAGAATFPREGGPWRLKQWKLGAGRFEPQELPAGELPVLARPRSDPTHADRTAQRQAFFMSVGVAEAPVHAQLMQLLAAMALISLAIWSIAALAGRWFSAQALLPVTQMAAEARAIRRAPEGRELLKIPSPDDEVADLGRAFNDLLVTLRENIAQQKRFAGDASHQLRTPLAAILTTVEVASRQRRDPVEYQRVLEVVQRRGHELQQIIEMLMTLSRGELPSSLSEFELIDLNAWCSQRLEAWQEHARFRDITLESAPTPILVRAHATMLGQIFDNLLDNAVKYSPPGTPITIGMRGDKRGACLSIADRGQGIAPDDLQQIFQPFFRSEQARWLGAAGVGLGLSIANRLAAILGGRLEVESSLSQGSIFRLTLPVVETPFAKGTEAVLGASHG